MQKYEEHHEMPAPLGWVIIIIFSASIIGFGVLIYLTVQEGPRHWDFGQMGDTPAETIYSTQEPETRRVTTQTPPLPEAQPKNPPKPGNVPLREREAQ